MKSETDTEQELPELTAPQASENSRLYRTKAFPFVSEGSVYCFALREYLEKPSIPRGESRIHALLPLPEGNVYGLTGGGRAHLFYFHNGFGVAHVGPVGEGPATGGALVSLGDNRLLGGWWGPESGGLFIHDVSVELGQGMEQFRGAKSAITPLPLPDSCTGVTALAGPDENGTVYALTQPDGLLFSVDSSSLQFTPLARIEGAAPVLALLPCGSVIGAYAEGRLWEHSTLYTGIRGSEAAAPCQKGKQYVAGVQSLLVTRDGAVYGGTSTDGYLFRYRPAPICGTGADGEDEVNNLGKPNRQSNIRALVEGHDGYLYGLVEEPGGMAHLFRWSSKAGFTDLGLLGTAFPEHWIAHSLGCMAVGLHGEIYIGETDDISHLFVYYPPIPRPGTSD